MLRAAGYGLLQAPPQQAPHTVAPSGRYLRAHGGVIEKARLPQDGPLRRVMRQERSAVAAKRAQRHACHLRVHGMAGGL